MAGLQAPLSTLRPALRCATHDSGPVWFAIPFLLETFTLYSLSISRRTSVRVQGTLNVGPQAGQRAFDQILHAALRIGHRGGLINAQRFLEQINRLIARTVESLEKLLPALFITAHGLVKHLVNGFRGRLFGLCSTHIFS